MRNNQLPLAQPDDFLPGWYAIASSRELVRNKPRSFERFGVSWVVFRSTDGVAVLRDRCPHRGVSLSRGQVIDGHIECPFHGFQFDAAGKCTHIPAHGSEGKIPRRMCTPSLPAREAHGFIFAWWGAVPAALPDIDWFHQDTASCTGFYETAVDTQVGLSRNIENQLDFTHIPFVHRKTIGRLVDGPEMEVDVAVDGHRLRAWLRGDPEAIELRLPNIWINRFSPVAFGILAFAPIDRERTRIYSRSYQRRVRFPVLAGVVNWLMGQSNRFILAEDIPVVDTHQPKVSPRLDGTEVLIPSDAPIIAYRKQRARLTAPR